MPMSPRLLRPRASSALVATDANAKAYINAVRTADGGQYMEAGVQLAIDAFIIGCKADGIWSAIKASCILMGARTLSGALTPLVGTAPTNNGPFVGGDYNRKTGLAGNGTTKFLNSGRANNADGQNDCHLAVWKSDTASQTNPYFIGSVAAPGGIAHIVGQNGVYSNESTGTTANASSAVGLHAVSRASSASYSYKRPGVSVATSTIASTGQSTTNQYVFAFNNGSNSPAQYSNSRLAFYSIGSSLTLSLLDSRVTTLYNAIGAAIP